MSELLKGISLRTEGDIIEIKLRDSGFKKYFEDKANINDKKQMLKLIKKLQDKGVPINIPDRWLD